MRTGKPWGRLVVQRTKILGISVIDQFILASKSEIPLSGIMFSMRPVATDTMLTVFNSFRNDSSY